MLALYWALLSSHCQLVGTPLKIHAYPKQQSHTARILFCMLQKNIPSPSFYFYFVIFRCSYLRGLIDTDTVASGLYYLSELVEEHTVLAKKLLTRMIYSVVVALSMLALVDRFPWTLCLLSIGSHLLYAQNLRRFPVVKLTDAVFLSSCGKKRTSLV